MTDCEEKTSFIKYDLNRNGTLDFQDTCLVPATLRRAARLTSQGVGISVAGVPDLRFPSTVVGVSRLGSGLSGWWLSHVQQWNTWPVLLQSIGCCQSCQYPTPHRAVHPVDDYLLTFLHKTSLKSVDECGLMRVVCVFVSLAGAVQVAPSRRSESDRHGGRKCQWELFRPLYNSKQRWGYAGLPRSMEGFEPSSTACIDSITAVELRAQRGT